MRIGRGNRSPRLKPSPLPLYPAQIPHDMGWNPGRCGGKPTTYRLSYDTAIFGDHILEKPAAQPSKGLCKSKLNCSIQINTQSLIVNSR
jgi:hypothetical protein